MPRLFMLVEVPSSSSEKLPCLATAPFRLAVIVHCPCATMKTWPCWSPAGTLCRTSGLLHLPVIVVLVCADPMATARATTAHTQPVLQVISSLQFYIECAIVHRNQNSPANPGALPARVDSISVGKQGRAERLMQSYWFCIGWPVSTMWALRTWPLLSRINM